MKTTNEHFLILKQKYERGEKYTREDVKMLFVFHAISNSYTPYQDYVNIAEQNGYTKEEAEEMIEEWQTGKMVEYIV